MKSGELGKNSVETDSHAKSRPILKLGPRIVVFRPFLELLLSPSLTSWPDDGHLKRTSIGCGVSYRFVRLVECEGRDSEIIQLHETSANHSDHAEGSIARIHPLPADRDAIPHQPGIGQVERAGSPSWHPDAAHQHNRAVGAYGAERRADLRDGGGGR